MFPMEPMNPQFTNPSVLRPSSPLKSMMQNHSVVAFFLIENSQTMTAMWPDLRDRYLQNVMTRIEGTHPTTPVTTFILETLPKYSTGFETTPRQYSTLQSGLQDLTFNHEPNNRLSVEKIWAAAEFLASADFRGQTAVRHLVIVAASTPFDDSFGINAMSYSGDASWHRLARKLYEVDIQCHVISSPIQDMTLLMNLFEETLRLQNFTEEPQSMLIDPQQVSFRLSVRPSLYSGTVTHTNHLPQRVLPRRNNSFPLPSHTNFDHDMLPNDLDHPPSLVSQLQQVHGLTKKKVYGSKPVRQPFVRVERMGKESPGAPAPLAMPISKTSPQSNGSIRMVSTSKAARISRVAQSSPTELQARRPSLPRRNSRMSSPDADPYPSPTSFSSSSGIPSPISPTYHPGVYSQPAPAVPLQQESILDPLWGPNPYQPLLPLTSNSFTTYSSSPSQPSATSWQDISVDMISQMPPTPQSMTSCYAYTAPQLSQEELGMNYKSEMADNAVDASYFPSKRRASCPDPEDEVPFTFNAEYVAATAALFKTEVLPAYPDFQPAYADVVSPRRAFYIANDQGSAPSSPSSTYDPGELYSAAEREKTHQGPLLQTLEYPVAAAGSPGLSYATSYSPGSSSSLTGWAG